mmetsp:Transcript_68587/g.164125  ORF Transcript_68587/g.164125 Transcript_68587/m.164125 type:complete len:262 (-) Transcript_68587:21-806(-)
MLVKLLELLELLALLEPVELMSVELFRLWTAQWREAEGATSVIARVTVLSALSAVSASSPAGMSARKRHCKPPCAAGGQPCKTVDMAPVERRRRGRLSSERVRRRGMSSLMRRVRRVRRASADLMRTLGTRSGEKYVGRRVLLEGSSHSSRDTGSDWRRRPPKVAGSGSHGGICLTRAAYERTSLIEAESSGDCPLSGSLLEPSEALSRKLGSRLGEPNASSSVRHPPAAESSSESLAVASAMAGGVEVMCSVEEKKFGGG